MEPNGIDFVQRSLLRQTVEAKRNKSNYYCVDVILLISLYALHFFFAKENFLLFRNEVESPSEFLFAKNLLTGHGCCSFFQRLK